MCCLLLLLLCSRTRSLMQEVVVPFAGGREGVQGVQGEAREERGQGGQPAGGQEAAAGGERAFARACCKVRTPNSASMAAAAQATVQQLQGDLEGLRAEHGKSTEALHALQSTHAALQATSEGLHARVQGLEEQLSKVRGAAVAQNVHPWRWLLQRCAARCAPEAAAPNGRTDARTQEGARVAELGAWKHEAEARLEQGEAERGACLPRMLSVCPHSPSPNTIASTTCAAPITRIATAITCIATALCPAASLEAARHASAQHAAEAEAQLAAARAQAEQQGAALSALAEQLRAAEKRAAEDAGVIGGLRDQAAAQEAAHAELAQALRVKDESLQTIKQEMSSQVRAARAVQLRPPQLAAHSVRPTAEQGCVDHARAARGLRCRWLPPSS